jgi:AcrR family transcriptional regulator
VLLATYLDHDKRTYNSTLRQERATATRDRILEAMAAIYEEEGRIAAATTRAVAARAEVREMTAYRYFSTREILVQGLWAFLNRRHAGERRGKSSTRWALSFRPSMPRRGMSWPPCARRRG